MAKLIGTDAKSAYAMWAATYDEVDNPVRDLDKGLLAELTSDLDGLSVLELGCGTGKNTTHLARAARVVAVDFSAEMLAVARKRFSDEHVTFLQADLRERLPVDGPFDRVTIDLVLEHIEDLAPVFSEVARVLAPDGQCIVIELNPAEQTRGKQAKFLDDSGAEVRVEAFHHSEEDFAAAFAHAGLSAGKRPAPSRLIAWVANRTL